MINSNHPNESTWEGGAGELGWTRNKAGTGWIEREVDFIGVQVPLNEIKVAIARWKEEEQTS